MTRLMEEGEMPITRPPPLWVRELKENADLVPYPLLFCLRQFRRYFTRWPTPLPRLPPSFSEVCRSPRFHLELHPVITPVGQAPVIGAFCFPVKFSSSPTSPQGEADEEEDEGRECDTIRCVLSGRQSGRVVLAWSFSSSLDVPPSHDLSTPTFNTTTTTTTMTTSTSTTATTTRRMITGQTPSPHPGASSSFSKDQQEGEDDSSTQNKGKKEESGSPMRKPFLDPFQRQMSMEQERKEMEESLLKEGNNGLPWLGYVVMPTTPAKTTTFSSTTRRIGGGGSGGGGADALFLSTGSAYPLQKLDVEVKKGDCILMSVLYHPRTIVWKLKRDGKLIIKTIMSFSVSDYGSGFPSKKEERSHEEMEKKKMGNNHASTGSSVPDDRRDAVSVPTSSPTPQQRRTRPISSKVKEGMREIDASSPPPPSFLSSSSLFPPQSEDPLPLPPLEGTPRLLFVKGDVTGVSTAPDISLQTLQELCQYSESLQLSGWREGDRSEPHSSCRIHRTEGKAHSSARRVSSSSSSSSEAATTAGPSCMSMNTASSTPSLDFYVELQRFSDKLGIPDPYSVPTEVDMDDIQRDSGSLMTSFPPSSRSCIQSLSVSSHDVVRYPSLARYMRVGTAATRLSLRLFMPHLRILFLLRSMLDKLSNFIDFRHPSEFLELFKVFRPVCPSHTRAAIQHALMRSLERRDDQTPVQVTIHPMMAKEGEVRLSLKQGQQRSIFGQLFCQLHTLPNSIFYASPLFGVKLPGFGAIDAGGPYREILSQLAAEINTPHPVYPGYQVNALFCNVADPGDPITIMPDPLCVKANSQASLMLNFLGKLLAACFCSSDLIALQLPRAFWILLQSERVKKTDLPSLNPRILEEISPARLLAYTREEFEEKFCGCTTELQRELQMRVTFPLEKWIPTEEYRGKVEGAQSLGNSITTVGVMQKGMEEEKKCSEARSGVRVDERTTALGYPSSTLSLQRLHTARTLSAILAHREVQQYDEVMSYIRAGFSAVVPLYILQAFEAEEIEKRICGQTELSPKDFLSQCKVQLPLSEKEMLENFVHSISNEDRTLLLRFATGQSRLPLSSKINVHHQQGVDCLPTSATCAFSLHIPKYTSEEIMRERVLYAIRQCDVIDADNVARDEMIFH